MIEDRRSKYATVNINGEETKPVDINFDITALDMMAAYVATGNQNIKRSNYTRLRDLFRIIDLQKYKNDPARIEKVEFIIKGLEARLEYGLNDPDMIVRHIYGGFYAPANSYGELSNEQINWIDMTVSSVLKDAILYNDIDDWIMLLTKFKSTDYRERGPVLNSIEDQLKMLNTKFRRVQSNNVTDYRFSLEGEDYENVMRDVYKQLSSPSNKLVFGSQALNNITGGGVEGGRVYTLLGLPGEGKSSTLLDMAIQLKRHNKNYICKDRTKKPCIVFLTMENSIKETIQRIFTMCVSNDILNYTEDECVEILKTQGCMSFGKDDPVNLFVYYKPNMSVDTSYCYKLIEDLEDEGFETICIIQDYLKVIRSANGTYGGDLRQQYGAVINEFKAIATAKMIPFITASQLNRDATKHVDEARVVNKADLVRLMGRSNVGDSNLILENSDWIAIIAPEYDRDRKKFLGMQRVKARYFIPVNTAVTFMPYIMLNEEGGIKLIEDYYSAIPVHRDTMREQMEMNNGVHSNNKGMINEIKDFADINSVRVPVDNEMPNIFMNAVGAMNFILADNMRRQMVKKVNKN